MSEQKESLLKLNGLIAFKVGMSRVFNEEGIAIPVTVLRFDPWIVTQIKTKQNDGYDAIQVSCKAKRAGRTSKAEKGHCSKGGFENGAYFTQEIRQELPQGISLGQRLDIESIQKGDCVKITGVSKGHGFSGVVKRHGFAGGPAAHGSKFHRRPGSVGNRTWPGRVLKGKRLPGHYGCDTVTLKNIDIVDVIKEKNVLLVKGSVPGARNSLVRIYKG